MEMLLIRKQLSISLIMGFVFFVLGNLIGTVALSSETKDDEIVTSRHQVTVDGRILNYTAKAGKIPIRHNETGEIRAYMFFVSYSLESENDKEPRPVTFLWNGGPGSNSSLVHLLGFGPKRIQTKGPALDNPGTWLDFTDLVFIDPVGTGYSRPVKAEYGPDFYQTRGDAESVAEFIRVYRNRFEKWDAPLFIGGESFGVRRAAAVAEILERRRIPLNGVILISLELPLGKLSKELRTALMIPTFTAAAFYHKKLAPDLQRDMAETLRKAEEWAEKEYAAALARRDALSESERQNILAQLAKFTGLNQSLLDPKTLIIEMNQFSQLLLKDENRVLGRYDSRLTGPFDPNEKLYDPTKDPSLKNIIDDVAVVRYLRQVLKYESDLLYQGPFGGGYPPPDKPRGDWMSVKWKWTPAELANFSNEEDQKEKKPVEEPLELPLRNAMLANPQLQVFMASGYFDLVCSYAGNAAIATRLEPELRNRVITKVYPGGHAIYTDEACRLIMKRDVEEFINNSLGRPKK